jgi:thioredoxin 1
MILSFMIAIALVSCTTNGQGVKVIKVDDFAQKIGDGTEVQLVDARTPEEFGEKRIKGAVNINVDDAAFETQITKLDKSKPLYFYCLSGARSQRAAEWAAKNGFKEVYNLDGGIRSWLNASKPVETGDGKAMAKGMSFDEYLAMIKSDKPVLVDFSAVWCGPCKILTPRVNNVEKKYAGKLKVIAVDVDKNSDVANNMNISGIPLLVLYKNGKEVWRNLGLIDEKELDSKVAEFIM